MKHINFTISRPFITNGNSSYYNTKYNGKFVTASLLKELNNSEEDLINFLLMKQKSKPEFILGTFIHTRILEEHKLYKRFYLSKSTTLEKDKNNKFGIDVHNWSLSQVICKNMLKANKNSLIEHYLFFKLKTLNNTFYIKGIADEIIIDPHKIKIRDVKTTFMLGKNFNLYKTIDKYHYDLQAYIYYICLKKLYIEKQVNFEISFLEKSFPWRSLNYIFEDKILMDGKEKFITSILKLENFLTKYNLEKKFYEQSRFVDSDFKINKNDLE